MEVIKYITIFVVIPLVAFLYKILWNKYHSLETLYRSCKGYEFCNSVFALKSEYATKQDISDMLDAKFKGFELRLINEGRLTPNRKRKEV
jgi:hypothetical protein